MLWKKEEIFHGRNNPAFYLRLRLRSENQQNDQCLQDKDLNQAQDKDPDLDQDLVPNTAFILVNIRIYTLVPSAFWTKTKT